MTDPVTALVATIASYTAMATVSFGPTSQIAVDASHFLNNSRLVTAIAIATAILLALAILTSLFEQRLKVEVARTEALRQSEQRFRALVQNASDIIAVTTADGTVCYTSASISRILGYAPQDWLGKKMSALVCPQEQNRAENFLTTALASPATNITAEIQLQHANGEVREFEVIANNLLAQPEIAGIVITYRDITERKRQEAALRKREESYRAFIEHSAEGIWRFELEVPLAIERSADEQLQHFFRYGYLAECNNVMAQMYGFDGAAEIVGRRLEDFLSSSNRQNVEYLRQFIRVGYRLHDAESQEVDRHGQLKYFLNNLVGIIENGCLVRAWGSQRDITERKQTETALRQRENELSLITNAVPVLISYIDTQQRYRFTNKAYEEWFGHPATEVNGKHIWEVIGDRGYELIRPYIAAVLSGQQVNYECELPYKNGGPRYISATYVPQYDSQGQVEGFVALITDISDRHRAEAALKESEERFRKLTEKVRVIPWEANTATGNFTYVGPQIVEILGYPLADWYTDNFWEQHIHPEDREWAIKYCISSSLLLDNYEFEYRMLAADGRVVWLYDIVHVFQDEAGPRLLRGFMIDITERKQAEVEREQLLAREQAARAEAEAANRMKDEFLATLSHELRTPLNAMLGWTHLLLTRKFEPATSVRALETIERNTKTLAQLVEDILDVSRIITGKLRLQVSPVELEAVISAASATVLPAAEAKQIHLESRLDSAVGVVLGDATRLQQIIWNLLSNAVKFTPQGGQVEVQLHCSNDRVQIQVSDTGKGIDPEFLPHVFERFRQADSSTTRAYGGLGLGLAIVRHLVELHGGTVQADSPGLGQGAAFTVELPIYAGIRGQKDQKIKERDQEQLSAGSPARLPTHHSLLTGLRVLVVDDELDARELLVAMLSEYGAEVAAVATAGEALAALPKLQPQVLVSDLAMPGEDGYTLIRRVKALDAGRQIPAIALTAYARAEDQQQARLAGFQLHISKPVEASELAGAIANLAQRHLAV